MFHYHYIGITSKYFYIQDNSDLSSSTISDKNSLCKIIKVTAFFFISLRLLFRTATIQNNKFPNIQL